MHAHDIEKAFRAFVKRKNRSLKELTAVDALDLATDHWLTTDVEGLRPERGDGLVAYFEVLNRGRGTLFEFGVNRIMTFAQSNDDYIPWLPAVKVRISVAFKPNLEVFQLGPVVHSFMCWDKKAVQAFQGEIRESAPFRLVANWSPHSTGIASEECTAPWGEPNHPTRALSWAIA
jgi:hypothetical protein